MPADSEVVRTPDGASPSRVAGRGRSLAEPAFSDDDGRADPDLRAAIASGVIDVDQLGSRRLLVAVVAVAEEVAADGSDKRSHMAVVSMVSADGERGLLAFTGLDAMQAWDPQARPVPVLAREAAQAALDDQAQALVIDVLGPVRVVIQGTDLSRLAGPPTAEPTASP